MPHLLIDYSANLETEYDMTGLCAGLRRVLLASGLFEPGAIRVRAFCAAHYAVADLLPENAYVDMRLRIGAGRTADDRRRVGDQLFAAANDFFADRHKRPHFALSLEVIEIDPGFSWKNNSMHKRLRGQ